MSASIYDLPDDSAAEAMGKHQRDVHGARLGWVKPHEDPPPPPPEPRHGGAQLGLY